MNLKDYLESQYSIEVTLDEYTDGSPCYIARIPELPGCMSDGDTPEEAKANLDEAKRDYIQSLLEDGLEVPGPSIYRFESLTIVTTPATATTHEKVGTLNFYNFRAKTA